MLGDTRCASVRVIGVALTKLCSPPSFVALTSTSGTFATAGVAEGDKGDAFVAGTVDPVPKARCVGPLSAEVRTLTETPTQTVTTTVPILVIVFLYQGTGCVARWRCFRARFLTTLPVEPIPRLPFCENRITEL